MKSNGEKSLKGRKLFIHPMTYSSAKLLAAVFRSSGIDSEILPPSTTETMDIGSFYTAGDECLPTKITIGDYLKVTRQPDFDPSKTAFMMPTANGPCRFGQYWSLLDGILKNMKMDDILIVNPTSSNGYGSVDGNGTTFFINAWLAVVSADILRKMKNKIRPYENKKGETDRIYENSLKRVEKVLESDNLNFKSRLESVVDALSQSRNEFRSIDANYIKGKPLIAVVGEIFCRHNSFANSDMLKKLESFGAETWLSDVSEWVFYTDWSREFNLIRKKMRFSKDMFTSKVKKFFMKRYEHKLFNIFHEDFKGYEEPSDVEILVKYAENYLPAWGALGEMTLSLGRSGYCYDKGVDGIVDISPFTCMNGIVSEAVYPSFSRDHNNIPCKVFYFDGTNSDIERDIEIFMELVKGYKSRKKVERVYPDYFQD